MRPAINKSILPIAIMVALFVGFLVIGLLIPGDNIRNIVQEAGPLGPLLLIAFLWLSNFFAPLSGSPFLFAGFYLYGRSVIIYAFISAVLAAATNFLVAKKWGRPLVVKLAGEDALKRLDGLTDDYGLVTLLIVRVFLGGLHDVISYAFGLTPLKFRSYFLVSTIGMIPSTLVWYMLSSKVYNATTFVLFVWAMLYIPLAIFVVYRKLRKNKKA